MKQAAAPAATLQHILNQYSFTAQTDYNKTVLEKLKICRTKALGYHLYKCADEQCAAYKYQYHSCRNRHCPACGALQKKQWVEDRKRELLPISYYHVVFTIPHDLNSIIPGNRKQLYALLFKAASATLLQFGSDSNYLGAQPGILCVLHTWGQQLSFHPHLHCIVSGGGVVKKTNSRSDKDLYWKNCIRKNNNFLFPVKALSAVYRALFLKELKQLISTKIIALTAAQQNQLPSLINTLYKEQWVVYAKKPFGGPQQVLQYLAAYTHKVAISNHRIISACNDKVTFTYKDYRNGNKQKQMNLPATEFLRRFEQHILPKGFTKIRTYGYLANRGRTALLNQITAALKLPAHPQKIKQPWQLLLYEMYGVRYNECPCCKKTSLLLIKTVFREIELDST